MDTYQMALVATFAAVLFLTLIACFSVGGHMTSWWGDIPSAGRPWILLSMLLGFAALIAVVGLAAGGVNVPPWASLSILCAAVFYLAMNAAYALALFLTKARRATDGCVPVVLGWGAASVVGMLLVALALVQRDDVRKEVSVPMVGAALVLLLHAAFTDACFYGHTFAVPQPPHLENEMYAASAAATSAAVA